MGRLRGTLRRTRGPHLVRGGRNAAGFTGLTALHEAARSNKPGVIDVLLEAGAVVNLQSADGVTPLHFASYSCDPEVTRALLQHGAEVHIKEANGKMPLHYAASQAGKLGAAECLDLLLRSGADTTMLDNRRNTALEYVGREVVKVNRRVREFEHVRQVLVLSPADRAWRCRGLLMLCRAHPDRVRLLVCCSGHAHGGMQSRAHSFVRAKAVSVPQFFQNGSGDPFRGGDDDLSCLAARLLGLQEEGVFRIVLGYR